MAPRKSQAESVPTPSGTASSMRLGSHLPSFLRFPFLVLSSLALSSALYSLALSYFIDDLGSVSRRLEGWEDLGGLIAWRATELAIGWFGHYDEIDMAALTLLSHLPPLYLLASFYGIQPLTVVTSMVIDILTTYLPFRLLRSIVPVQQSTEKPPVVTSRLLTDDLPINVLTTSLAAAVYGTVIYGSYHSWLPVHLVTHFDGLRDISAAHGPALPLLVATCLPLGLAAKEFLFTPVNGLRLPGPDMVQPPFNPSTATLAETVYHNLWGYSSRTKAMIIRTTTLVLVTAINTLIQLFVTVAGAELVGAIGYSCLWAAAAGFVGLAFLWVDDV